MDLNHCLPFIAPMQIYPGSYSALSDASIVVITAGAGQKEGETRLDLLRRNLTIFEKIVHQITSVNRDCILLVVSNPVDILTYFTHKLSGFPASRVIGSKRYEYGFILCRNLPDTCGIFLAVRDVPFVLFMNHRICGCKRRPIPERFAEDETDIREAIERIIE